MIKFFNYNNNCWWCGKPADSKEHKYKKSDLKKEFKTSQYKGNSSIVRIVGKQEYKVQGINSDQLKFNNVICSVCNNKRSQPFDVDYDTFTSFIKENEKIIIENGIIKFTEIYGKDWFLRKQNLIKYLIKHICCRISDANVEILEGILNYLNDKSTLKFFNIYMEIRTDVCAVLSKIRSNQFEDGYIAMGDLMYNKSISTGLIYNVFSFISFRWLRINYSYDDRIKKFINNFEGDQVILPYGYNVDPKSILKIY